MKSVSGRYFDWLRCGVLVFLSLLIMVGCSGGGGPTEPDINSRNLPETTVTSGVGATLSAGVDTLLRPNAVNSKRYHNEIIVNDNYLYMAHYGEGVMVFDLTNPGYPVQVSSFGALGNDQGIRIEGDVFYMIDQSGDLSTFDYSVSKVNPPFMDTNSERDSYFARSVVVIGDYAYVGEGNYGIYVYDVSDPYNIELISDLALYHVNGMINDGPVIYAVADMTTYVII
jgi:hypothetical protein